jgi:hypothetical protein
MNNSDLSTTSSPALPSRSFMSKKDLKNKKKRRTALAVKEATVSKRKQRRFLAVTVYLLACLETNVQKREAHRPKRKKEK